MDHDARGTPASWAATVAHVAQPGVLLRLLALACGVAVVVGSMGPWAEGHANWSTESSRILGFWRAEGQLAFLAGVIASGTAAWRIGRRGRSSTALLLLAFSIAVAVTAPLQADIDRWRTYRGMFPVEGWIWFEPRWGLTLTLVSAAAGCAVTLVTLLHTLWPTTDGVHDGDTAATAPPPGV